MYTQCTNCKAVFRVNMKELTVANGKLRCGECDSVFDAMETLSTNLPNKQNTRSNNRKEDKQKAVIEKKKNITGFKLNFLKTSIILALLLLFTAQFLYSNKNWFTHELQRTPNKVQMISRTITSHPNDSDVLLISASIENKATQAQPYPYVEVTLLDNKENTIALRRFKPSEYLQHHNEGDVFHPNKEVMLQLKIADPGEKATRFNFKFM
ncbi:MAG: zinc-ribbon and DUF3426 domain-containing protein [Cocleimonas sp.]|nr:zinc-ribbon and DUF3426 domain-containing protein [Cocleimonas sp.]